MDLRIKKVRNGYILYDAKGERRHSHFTSYNKARTCLSFINKNVMPNNTYYIESCHRLLSRKEMARLNKKQRYHNIQNGARI